MQKRSDNMNDEKLAKFRHMYFVLVKWMTINQNDRYITNWFRRNGYSKIAIYGMRELGFLLYDEVVKAGMSVEYIVDKNADNMNIDVESTLYTPDDELPAADILVITAVHYSEEIKENLKGKVNCAIVSLEDIINMS